MQRCIKLLTYKQCKKSHPIRKILRKELDVATVPTFNKYNVGTSED